MPVDYFSEASSMYGSSATTISAARGGIDPLIDDEAELDSLSAHSAQHFCECNELLDGYMPAAELLPLQCPRRKACVHCCHHTNGHWDKKHRRGWTSPSELAPRTQLQRTIAQGYTLHHCQYPKM